MLSVVQTVVKGVNEHYLKQNCDLRGLREEGGPLEPPSCPVLQVSCVCSNTSSSRRCFLILTIISNVLPSDSTNSGDNMYTMINTVPPGGSRPNVRPFICLCIMRVCVGGYVGVSVCVIAPTLVFLFVLHFVPPLQFPMGAGGDGPLGGMAGMEPHHINGSLGTVPRIQFITIPFINSCKTHTILHVFCISGSGDMDSLPKVRKTCYISICSSVLLVDFGTFLPPELPW